MSDQPQPEQPLTPEQGLGHARRNEMMMHIGAIERLLMRTENSQQVGEALANLKPQLIAAIEQSSGLTPMTQLEATQTEAEIETKPAQPHAGPQPTPEVEGDAEPVEGDDPADENEGDEGNDNEVHPLRGDVQSLSDEDLDGKDLDNDDLHDGDGDEHL